MNLDDILGQIPLDQIAGRLGVDQQTARNAVQLALPALVSGMQANAQDPAGATSLATALGQHDDDLLDGSGAPVEVSRVDTSDGSNIVGHVFGDQREQVVSQLAGASGTDQGLIAKLLPMLAPIVMSFLAKRVLGGGGRSSGSGGAGGLGDVLGNVLGGGGAGGAGGGGLADILGQVLGGSSRGGSGGSGGGIDIGDLLGGLLGGGRR